MSHTNSSRYRPATVALMLSLRPADALIPNDCDEENARSLVGCIDTIDDLCALARVDPTTDEQRAAMWCADPADMFGGLDDLVARVGLDEAEIKHVAKLLFDLLPADAQQNLRELEVWGLV